MRHVTHTVIEVVGGLALLAALVVAVGAWRLSQGPMSIEFLRPYVVDALRDTKSPLRLGVDDVFLTWAGWGQPLSLRVMGVRVLGRDGNPVATVPEASIGVSLRALARGMFAPTTLDLIGPQAAAVRNADGSLSLQLGGSDAGRGNVFDALVGSLLAQPDRRSPFGYLRHVSISGARLRIEDRASGQSWVAPAANVLFSRDVYGVRVDASLDVDLAGIVGRFYGEAEYHAAARRSTAVVWFVDLSPARVAQTFAMLKPLAAIEAPVTGAVAASLDSDFNVTGGEIDLTAKAGRVAYPELWPNGLPVKSARLKATFERAPDRFTISELKLDAGTLTASFTGTGTRLADAVAIGGELEAASNSIEAWDTIWPKGVAAGARAWITANLEHGKVPEAHANLALRLPDDPAEPLRIESVAGTFRVEGATVHFMRPVTPVVGASGRGTFDADRITIRLTAGTLRRLRIEDGTVDFTKLDRNPSHVDVDVTVRGPLRDPLMVLDSPRFHYIKKLGMDPMTVEGESATRLVVSLPTLKDVPMSGVKIRVASNLEGVAIHNALLGRDLTDGKLSLKLDNNGMDVSGTAKIAGLPSDLVWVENFDPKDSIARRYRLKTRLDDAARSRLGIDLAPYLTGPTPADLTFIQPVRGPSVLQLRLGLDETALALADLGWKKPRGAPGAATMVASLIAGKLTAVSALSVVAPQFELDAQAKFAPDGKTLSRVDVTRLKVGATDIKGAVVHRADGGWNVDLSGAALDASKIVHPDENETAPKRTKPPLAIDLDVDKAWLRSKVPVANVKGRLVYDGTEWSTGALNAALPQGHKLTLLLAPQKGGVKFTLDSDDAGETMRQFGIYDNFLGGKLKIDATRTGGVDGSWKGTMTATDFRAVKAPGLAKLLTVASLTGIASILSGQGIYFNRFDLPFKLADRVLTFEKARLVGSELGLTGDGDIDFDRDNIKASGTIVPAYTLNSLLGHIPLLGRLFTGSEGSGMFAATYKLEGSVDDPTVTVNPLAMLAPGFLRTLFEGIITGGIKPGEEMEQPPQN